MIVIISRKGEGRIGNYKFKCTLGKAGTTLNKIEGDNKTPLGVFHLRQVMFRQDRISRPKTFLPTKTIKPKDIWCDQSSSREYNKLCSMKYDHSSECLWRKDSQYNILIVIGYNDQPVEKFKGSAIFIHLCKKHWSKTKGCIAIKKKDMFKLLSLNPRKIKII